MAVAGPRPGRPRLLVLRALGLGDLLTAVPAYRGLRRAFPAARIALAAPAALAPLARLSGAVDAVLPMTDPAGGPVAAWNPPWTGPPPDLAVNLHGRGPQSTRALRALQPARLWAFGHPDVSQLDGPEWTAAEPERHRWCRLVGHYGVPADPDDLDLDRPGPARAAAAAGAVLVHPGAAHRSRRWPADRFADVARALRDAGHRVVVTGGPAERDLALAVARRARLAPADVRAGGTDVLDLAALVAAARLVVCGDTGVAHLATAYRTPSVLLFGPTPPAAWGPPPDRPWHRVLWHGSGTGDPLADRPDPALLAIGVPEVVGAAAALLAAGPAAAPTAAGAAAAGAGGPSGGMAGAAAAS